MARLIERLQWSPVQSVCGSASPLVHASVSPSHSTEAMCDTPPCGDRASYRGLDGASHRHILVQGLYGCRPPSPPPWTDVSTNAATLSQRVGWVQHRTPGLLRCNIRHVFGMNKPPSAKNKNRGGGFRNTNDHALGHNWASAPVRTPFVKAPDSWRVGSPPVLVYGQTTTQRIDGGPMQPRSVAPLRWTEHRLGTDGFLSREWGRRPDWARVTA